MREYLNLLRIKHYIKNLIIFLPLFFSGEIKDTKGINDFIIIGGGFILFSMSCSLIYIINDIKDVDKDKNHPIKKKRPLPSGKISIAQAKMILVSLLLLIVFTAAIMRPNLEALIWLVVYVVINIIYSFKAKNIAILDVVLLGMGYPLRLLFGGALTNTKISAWLFLTVLFVAFYLAYGKRYGECIKVASSDTRLVLKDYNKDFLKSNMYLNLVLGIVFYSLWTVEKGELFVYTVPIVMVICMKYNHLIETKTDGDPINTIFSSKSLILYSIIYLVIMIALIYGHFYRL